MKSVKYCSVSGRTADFSVLASDVGSSYLLSEQDKADLRRPWLARSAIYTQVLLLPLRCTCSPTSLI